MTDLSVSGQWAVGVQGARLRVLYVEDEAFATRVVRSLRLLGIDMTLARDLVTAKEALKIGGAGVYELAVIDLGLPDGNGIELFPLLRVRGIDALVVSGHLATEMPNVLAWGALAVGKPISPTRLAECIRAVVAHRQQLDQAFRVHWGLSERQFEVVALASRLISGPEIAERIGCSARTVEDHRHRALAKLHVNTIRDAVDLYLRWHGVGPQDR